LKRTVTAYRRSAPTKQMSQKLKLLQSETGGPKMNSKRWQY
jgi:hypothetical protein